MVEDEESNHTIVAPTAEPFVQIKPPPSIASVAVPSLQITQPVTSYINERSQYPSRNSSSNQYDPNLTRIPQLRELSQYPRSS